MLPLDGNGTEMDDHAEESQVILRDLGNLARDHAQHHWPALAVGAVHRHHKHGAIIALECLAAITRKLLGLARIANVDRLVAL